MTSEPDQMSAVLCGPGDMYRVELRRVWNAALPLLPVGMLNPSTADHRVNDPTVLTLIHFGKLWGYGGLLIVNQKSFRASSPKDMQAAVDPIGPDNDRYVVAAMEYASAHGGKFLAAWGNDGFDRQAWFVKLAERHGVELMCLGTTLSGAPKHPLARGVHRIARDQQPVTWRRAR